MTYGMTNRSDAADRVPEQDELVETERLHERLDVHREPFVAGRVRLAITPAVTRPVEGDDTIAIIHAFAKRSVA